MDTSTGMDTCFDGAFVYPIELNEPAGPPEAFEGLLDGALLGARRTGTGRVRRATRP